MNILKAFIDAEETISLSCSFVIASLLTHHDFKDKQMSWIKIRMRNYRTFAFSSSEGSASSNPADIYCGIMQLYET